MRNTAVYQTWKPGIAEGFAYGVSLHSHTHYSRESLQFIPKYARRSKVLARVMDLAEWQYRSRTGKPLNCSRAYWTPPLSPLSALEVEAEQIAKRLHLPAMVSLTDHDDCRAGIETGWPISIEWTIPFEPSFFHLGVHNLPVDRAAILFAEMQSYTADPDPSRLAELLDELHAYDDVLFVLNHPLWDEGLIGATAHADLAGAFLHRFRPWIHALELNGLRCLAENERVIDMAHAFQLPAISGGDRHGREPNSNINLTRAASFTISSVRSWCDRVFFTCERESTRPLSFFFGANGPPILKPFLLAMNLLEQPALRPFLRAGLR